MMSQYRVTMLLFSGCFVAGQMSRCWTQEPSSEQAKPVGSQTLWGVPTLSTWTQSAEDLKRAAEAAERFGDKYAETLETAAFHFSEITRQFDPFGYKTAFQTLQEQNRTIQRLMAAEIHRLTAENELLRKSEKSARSALKRQNRHDSKRVKRR